MEHKALLQCSLIKYDNNNREKANYFLKPKRLQQGIQQPGESTQKRILVKPYPIQLLVIWCRIEEERCGTWNRFKMWVENATEFLPKEFVQTQRRLTQMIVKQPE